MSLKNSLKESQRLQIVIPLPPYCLKLLLLEFLQRVLIPAQIRYSRINLRLPIPCVVNRRIVSSLAKQPHDLTPP